ncbi:hypothetical protein ADL27_38620 [Streptomyces sp. NRRL F-6602]|nr:hypothetical protein ADL27_38620 [Streptomyces sp. NRRL F-6602]
MSGAGVRPGQLARSIGVATKTVERWLNDGARIPHARTRADVASLLGVDENVLWPHAVRQVVKTGPDREIVATYPYRAACPTSVWSGLIDSASTRIEFAGYTNYFIWQEHPRIADKFRAKLEAGCAVRFLVGDVDSPVTAQREAVEGVPLTLTTRISITMDALTRLRGDDPPAGLETRISDRHIALSVFRFDGEMLVTPHLSSLLGHESPTLHLRRRGPDGLFDRFAGHVDALWKDAREAWA